MNFFSYNFCSFHIYTNLPVLSQFKLGSFTHQSLIKNLPDISLDGHLKPILWFWTLSYIQHIHMILDQWEEPHS